MLNNCSDLYKLLTICTLAICLQIVEQMSFGDFARQSQNSPANFVEKDIYGQLSDSLQIFQRSCTVVKDRITEMRRRKVGPAEKNDLDIQIKDIREMEGRLKNQLDFQFQQLENMPRTEAAAKRATLGKLLKDYERIKVNLQALSSEAQLIKVSRNSGGEPENFSRVGASGGVLHSSSDKYANYSTAGEYSKSNSVGMGNSHVPLPAQSTVGTNQKLVMMPLMQGQEVDDAILEERDKEIFKINKDLALVNEMFKDMAVLVEKQGEHIAHIGATTESSHETAKQGLAQVNQAAAYQPTCSIS